MPARTHFLVPALVAAMLAVTLSACSDDDDDDDVTDQPPTVQPGGTALAPDALQGTWSTGCALDDPDDAADGYRLASLSFDGDAFTHESDSFDDAGCTTPVLDDDDIALTGTFTLGRAVLLSDGLEATEIDFVAVPPEAAAGTAARTLLDIARIDGDTLYLGDGDFDDIRDTDADERPGSLELDEPYTRTSDSGNVNDDPNAGGAQALAGDEWYIESIDGQQIVDGTEPAIGFADDGRVFGNLGCNSLTGEWESEGDALSFDMLGTTLAACPEEGVEDQERGILAVLNSISTYSVADGALQLVAEDGRVIVARRR